MNSPRFVVDTNTLVSAALIEGSTPDRAIRRAFRNGALLTSPDTLDEATEVLTREKFDQYASWERRHELLEALADQSTVVEPTVAVDVCRDPDDNKFLELAVEGDADLIISGDSDLLSLHPFEGIAILSPAGFLESKWA
jgi:putative PIN family toxin of toxin-antitoxin system